MKYIGCPIHMSTGLMMTPIYTLADLMQHLTQVMGLIMPFVIISFALTDMIAIGSSVLISLSLGKGKSKEASILFSISCFWMEILGCKAVNVAS